jgi:two-component system cell cycle sensor histidine kinase/response regulator CckA
VPAAEAPQGGTEKLLLVEDDAQLRAVAARALRAAGYDLMEAATGHEALTAWEKAAAPFRLLVTDMVMPGGMNGIELGRRLRGDSPELRVLVMSGYHPELPRDLTSVGDGFAFLMKPYRSGELLKAVRAELDRA